MAWFSVLKLPTLRHFCLLKAVRIVSALNAALKLAEGGYTQEIAVLMRTVVECATHIEYVLDRNDSDAHRAAVSKYVREFFEDDQRGVGAEIRRAQVRQGYVHAAIGQTLDEIAEKNGFPTDRVPAAKLYSHIYRTSSNYVHAKYPEVMDLYGGRPGRFHLNGMSGTPKDAENIETIEAYIESASNAIVDSPAESEYLAAYPSR